MSQSNATLIDPISIESPQMNAPTTGTVRGTTLSAAILPTPGANRVRITGPSNLHRSDKAFPANATGAVGLGPFDAVKADQTSLLEYDPASKSFKLEPDPNTEGAYLAFHVRARWLSELQEGANQVSYDVATFLADFALAYLTVEGP